MGDDRSAPIPLFPDADHTPVCDPPDGMDEQPPHPPETPEGKLARSLADQLLATQKELMSTRADLGAMTLSLSESSADLVRAEARAKELTIENERLQTRNTEASASAVRAKVENDRLRGVIGMMEKERARLERQLVDLLAERDGLPRGR